ncbi:hypothetical protein [Herbidospora cretacea]|uniref:hypothetical protein n=1 Tax=Herbidospora cretacea TaxID=28444 RepID=UPI000B27C10D|nr:hypothetical protein [Herbidospora cretacea]
MFKSKPNKKKKKKQSTTTTTTTTTATHTTPSPGLSLFKIFNLDKPKPRPANTSNSSNSSNSSTTKWTRVTSSSHNARGVLLGVRRAPGEGSSSSKEEEDVEQDEQVEEVIPSGVEDLIREMEQLLAAETDVAFELPVKELGLALHVDYTPLLRLKEGEEADFISDRISRITGSDRPIGLAFMKKYGYADPKMTAWFMRALCLISDNTEALMAIGVHPGQAVQRLIGMAKQQARMSITAPSHGFEMQILQVGGFLQTKLLSGLVEPDGRVRLKLLSLYNPEKTETGVVRIIPPLDKPKLRNDLGLKIIQVVQSELSVWRQTGGVFTEVNAIADIAVVANYLQGWLKERFGLFPLAAVDSPYHKGWIYGEMLESTESKPGDRNELLGWLKNRGDLIGWSKDYGSAFAVTNYDPKRREDREALADLYEELLTKPNFVKMLKSVSKLTACHSRGQGKVMIQPWYHNKKITNRVNFRWRQARTLIHEFLHALTHQDLIEISKTIGHGQILVEGLTDMLTVHFFTQLVKDVQADKKTQLVILGDEPFAPPKASYYDVGYGNAGEKAVTITALVGMDNVMAAYFLGATKLIGLKDEK